MRRETQNVLLVLLGGAVLKIAINGQYLRYVKPSLQPWLIAAGAATVLLAVIGIVRDIRTGGSAAPAGNAGDGHGHDHGSRSPWLLLLPALAIFLIAPPALGADKVARSDDRSLVGQPAPSGAQFDPLPSNDAPLLRMGDAVTRAVWDDSGTLDGRQIRLVGFVVRMPDGSIDLARLVIGCCAADATPVKVRMQGDGLDAYEPDTWLEVRGEMVPGSATEANGYVPLFTVASLREVPAPEDPYES
jgi:uncharacterized repeat protein (TIGR03943 family)